MPIGESAARVGESSHANGGSGRAEEQALAGRVRWAVTCEHAGNRVPEAYRDLFAGADEVLESHRGWDPGALALFRLFSGALADWSIHAEVSRLVVELNRSLHHPAVFSEYTRRLDAVARARLVTEYYRPYRDAVGRQLGEWWERGDAVTHLSVHTFNPVLDGNVRTAEVGLLYDPRRAREKALARAWQRQIRMRAPRWRVRLNYPYRGNADGLTTSLRSRFPDRYVGIELEVSQALATEDAQGVGALLLDALQHAAASGDDAAASGEAVRRSE